MIEILQCHRDGRVENHLTQDGRHGPRVRRRLSAPPHTMMKNSNKRLAYVCDPRHKVMEEICPKVICRISQALHGEPNLWALKFIEEALSMLHGNNEVINVDHYVFPDVPGITHPNIWVSFGFLEPKLPNDRGELLMES